MRKAILRRYFDPALENAGVLGQVSDESSQSLRKQLIRSISSVFSSYPFELFSVCSHQLKVLL
jgi:hypothetical protein